MDRGLNEHIPEDDKKGTEIILIQQLWQVHLHEEKKKKKVIRL